MGKDKRDHVQQVLEKGRKKKRLKELAIGNPIARKLIVHQSYDAVVNELTKGSTDDQIGRLDELVGTGTLQDRKLKETLMKKAPGEMDKAIRNFRKHGKEITVESLCAEVKSDIKFQALCRRIGLEISWFETLAQERMKAQNI